MKRFTLALSLALFASGVSPSLATCGNIAHNIARTTECEAYTTDWQVHKDLRDKRLGAMSEWIDAHAEASGTLDIMMKEGMLARSHALVRNLDIHKDADMWRSRGCAALPLCVQPQTAKRPYCGPRDRARGRCQ